MFATELRSLGGEERFNQIKLLFRSPKRKLQTSWDAYFATIPEICKLIWIVSENCSNIAFSGGPSDLTIDDDICLLRSSNWVELGYSRRKGLKSFGCVLNIACDCATGLFVSGSLTEFGDTATSGVKLIMQRALQVETVE
jgi:hypothetical protein